MALFCSTSRPDRKGRVLQLGKHPRVGAGLASLGPWKLHGGVG